MGVASSSHAAIGNGLPLSSSTKDFYSPRVNGRTTTTTSSYNPAANQPQMLNNNRRHSPPPPLPSVTASPLLKQDKFPLRSEVIPSNRTLQQNSGGSSSSLPSSSSTPTPSSARKSILHTQGAPTAGKPRIFAMTAQVDELDRETASFSPPPPPYVQYSAKRQQQQQQRPSQSSTTTTTTTTMHVQQPQPQYQPSATNGSDSFKPAFSSSSSSSVKPPSTPFKFPTNHNNVVVERQQQQLPPTPHPGPPTPPPTHYRGSSRSSRRSISTIPDEDDDNYDNGDEDVQRPRSQHVPLPTMIGSRSRKNSKSDEEPRPQSQNILQSLGSRSRKNSKSDEQSRPQSQNILLQAFGSRSRKNSKLDEESRPQSLLQSPGSRSRKDSKSDEQQQQRPQSQNITLRTPPSRTRKLSKHRPEIASQYGSISDMVLPGTPDSQQHHRRTSSIRTLMTKSRPTTPVAGAGGGANKASLFGSPKSNNAPLEPAIQLDEDTRSKAGILLDDDPFARVEGVTMLRPLSSFGGDMEEEKDRESVVVVGSNEKNLGHKKSSSTKGPSISSSSQVIETEERSSSVSPPVVEGVAPPTPVSPEEHRKTKKKKKKKRHDEDSQTESTLPAPMLDNSDAAAVTSAPTEEPEPELEPEPILPLYTIIDFLSDPQLLSSLLTFFSFYDWCLLSSLSKEIRLLLVQSPALRETVLERFLKTVGYSRWVWDDPDPLSLSLQVRELMGSIVSFIISEMWLASFFQDLNDYMRGVSTPTHEYARVAGMYAHSLTIHPNHRDPSLIDIVRILTASTRAYTRVILRLRAQAEKEAILVQQSRGLGITMKPSFSNNNNYPPPSSSSVRGNHSRVSSRAPSPTTSNGAGSSSGGLTNMQEQNLSLHSGLTFRSPLFRLRRAPLLRVFVPSPEGDWLSDKSVLACEEECKRAGVMHLIRLGDVVWDVAVGDEGNVGRLVWDGSYLIVSFLF